MNGTFNGVRLRRITSRNITKDATGVTLTSVRVIEAPPELEAQLRLNTPAVLILSDEIIEGRIVHFSASLRYGYEITIESKAGSGLG